MTSIISLFSFIFCYLIAMFCYNFIVQIIFTTNEWIKKKKKKKCKRFVTYSKGSFIKFVIAEYVLSH